MISNYFNLIRCWLIFRRFRFMTPRRRQLMSDPNIFRPALHTLPACCRWAPGCVIGGTCFSPHFPVLSGQGDETGVSISLIRLLPVCFLHSPVFFTTLFPPAVRGRWFCTWQKRGFFWRNYAQSAKKAVN